MKPFAVAALLLPLVAPVQADQKEMNLFDWSTLAPIVVAGTSLGENGRWTELRVTRVFRGDVEPGEMLRIDVRYANRMRDRMLDPKAMHLDRDLDYLLLLEEVERSKREPIYRLVRGVDGARELPPEGREAILFALDTFVEIQDTDNDQLWWHHLSKLLEATEPRLISTALEQFLKFRRGTPELVPALVPLLDHPQPAIRADAARLIGQIVERNATPDAIPDEAAVRAELIARARRDDSTVVRVAAVEALAAYPPDVIDEVLERVALEDPEQEVRYAAELIRMEHRQNGRGRTP